MSLREIGEGKGLGESGKRCRILLGLIRRLWVVGATEDSGLCKITKIHNLPPGSFVQDVQRVYHNMALWYTDGGVTWEVSKKFPIYFLGYFM